MTGLGNGFFKINEYMLPGSVILFKKRFFMWAVREPSLLKTHTLDFLFILRPMPSIYLISEVVFIGTGKNSYSTRLPMSFYEHFRKGGIEPVVLSTVIWLY